MPNTNREKGRSIRVEDDLWLAAQDAARYNGEPLAAVIRRDLRRYVKATARQRQQQQQQQQQQQNRS